LTAFACPQYSAEEDWKQRFFSITIELAREVGDRIKCKAACPRTIAATRCDMALEKEIETYQNELPKLLQHEGKFALIHGEEVSGPYDTYDDALKSGYEKYELKPFLIKRIQAVEQVQYFTRDLVLCRT
jgi:hypothetical protein